MLKIEYVWRDLLYRAIEKKQSDFTMLELGKKFKLSTSLISHSLFPLRELGIVKITKVKSKIIDTEKLLFFWATRRNLKKDVIYQTYSNLPLFEREASLPADVIPTAYSALRLYFDEIPADYENIYFYSDNLKTIQQRFPIHKKTPNLFILKPDPYLKNYGKTPIGQIFADLWNLSDWYAKEFSDALLLKIRKQLGL